MDNATLDTEQYSTTDLEMYRRSVEACSLAVNLLRPFDCEKWVSVATKLLREIFMCGGAKYFPFYKTPRIYKGRDKRFPPKDTEFLMVRSADSLEEADKAHSDIKETLDWFISQGTLRVIKEWREDDGKTLFYTIEDLECLNK